MQLNFGSYSIVPIHPKDAWNICNFAVANENRLKRYFPKTLEQNLTPDLSNIFVEKKVKQFELKEEFLFTLRENESNTLVGLIYIKALDWTKKKGEFAYAIDYNVEGKGIMTEAIQQLSEYAFKNLGIETLQIIVHKSNIGSVKVADNCNFTYIKTLKSEHTPPGEAPLNMELYELYKEIE
ncbi:GNAT family N-acetyltransferase [Jejuia pallidilutea]|uniref:Ribosomal-protein-L7p-serine acetyltransferase n=1 Tax=Jejuia pallidilutea TaxID=504487 RepID=A0A090VKE0_9FLAO|nr:GNAT family protein [Jejuia pallidilutea]GAL65216.1 ribosomal-protein-L7p-serine acetyltransferase [Jejuia pallidilutea]GAL69267.1 ribosomal-protein-L7p-serine acetyltransferase [Jejuia pallidilutea]GAL89189.1 ribosomal-protein-L7p-serine acetyltransferase [Jejuia pallidilutea]